MKKTQVIGNVVRDAQVKEMNGRKVINFVVAVNSNYKDANGQKVERADFFNCAQWKDANQSTEVAKYLLKGTKVFVEGEPSAVLYKTKENQHAVDNRINVHMLQLLSASKKDDNNTMQETAISEAINDDLPY